MEPESALVRKSQAGDAAAFEQLIKKYEPKIYSLLLGMTRDRQEAADLFQETFLSAWRNLRAFKGSARFSTWLYRIAVNAALMRRRKKRLPTVSMDVPVQTEEEELKRDFPGDWSANPLASLENRELAERLEEAVGLLPEAMRSVLILSDIQGLTDEEVGNVLKISVPAVKSRLHRARLFLRQRLSGYFQRN